MRISDWSSDVCASDLSRSRRPGADRRIGARQRAFPTGDRGAQAAAGAPRDRPAFRLYRPQARLPLDQLQPPRRSGRGRGEKAARFRSEEHTSELQSLMRISYAVFCLKKKKTKKKITHVKRENQ